MTASMPPLKAHSSETYDRQFTTIASNPQRRSALAVSSHPVAEHMPVAETIPVRRQGDSAAAIGTESRERLIQCRALVRQRRIVGDSLGFHLCPAPALDILLDLYLAAFEGRPTYVWQSCVAANIPVSTAHRKITGLISDGFVERAGAMSDKRLVSIRLSAHGLAVLDKLLDRLAQA